MIAEMSKVYVAARSAESDKLLSALGRLGVVHLAPVDPQKAVAEQRTVSAIDRLDRAIQWLSFLTPEGSVPETDPLDAAGEVLRIQHENAERHSRLNQLYRQLQQLAVWGDVRLEQFRRLREAGLDIRFCTIDPDLLGQIEADCVQPLGPSGKGQVLVATVSRSGEPKLPEEASPLELPAQDRPSIRAEAAEIDRAMKDDAQRLRQLAHLIEPMRKTRHRLLQQAEYSRADGGALKSGHIVAVQGWAPAEQVDELTDKLAEEGLAAAVQTVAPSEDEKPPTLIRYPWWSRPMKGLFDLLGTLPGYREYDLSPFFMIALPVFAAMLIGDAGYGLLFIALPLIFYRRAAAAAGTAKTQLLIVIGLATLAWGLLSGVIFGLTPQDLTDAGGVLAPVGRAMRVLQVVHGSRDEQLRLIMQLSFFLGTVHLSVARLRQGLAFAPNLRALSHVGWALFLWGVLGLIWFLFFDSLKTPPEPIHPAVPYLLGVGGAMAILFAHPSRNPLKMLGMGIASFPLSAMSTFSDTVSYLRLMAVGFASVIIAQTFNDLAAQLAGTATWLAGAVILVLGHGLNIALCLIALLAHGVRLNMLEFSTNAGVSWTGYPYKPFRLQPSKES